MENDDVFRFEDFLGGNKIEDLRKMKSDLLKEGLFSDDDLEISDDFGEPEDEYEINKQSSKELRGSDFLNYNEEDEDDIINHDYNPYNNFSQDDEDDEDSYSSEDELEESNESYSDDDSYVLYKDKSEEFVCDIAIEGVSQKDTEVRLVIESSDWNLMFKGEVKNGKCIIPIKKLSLFNEGQKGNIKLEVNADGNLFTPWEDEFIIKVSKKVTVSLNEDKKIKPVKKQTGVKVKVNKKRP
jgi:hypothetical protein